MSVTTEIRQTGAIAKVYDDHLNDWTDLAGQDINVPVAYQYAEGDGPDEWEQAWWGYRGQASMARSSDGTEIVRYRIGDGSSGDRNIYSQDITDATDPAQWEAWTLLYSGDNYALAAALIPSSSINLVHAKDDGIYLNDSLKISVPNVVRIKWIPFWPNFGGIAIMYQTVHQDEDGQRRLDWWFVRDITTPTNPIYDAANYRWYRCDAAGIYYNWNSTDALYRFYALAPTQARSQVSSQSLISTRNIVGDPTAESVTGGIYTTPFNKWLDADHIKGPSGQAGYHVLNDIQAVTDHAAGQDTSDIAWYYLLWTEQDRTTQGEVLSNLQNPCYWARSRNVPSEWSEPVPVGYSIWGLAGMVFVGDYAYLAGNGRVLQRPVAITEVDLSDYILDGQYDLPRESQPGTGKLTLANQANTVGEMLGLTATSEVGKTEQRMDFSLGLKRFGDEDWTWKTDDLWWVSDLAKTKDEGGKEHIELSMANFWHRLDNPFREPIYIPGRLDWSDWLPGGTNQLFNYTNSRDGVQSEFFRVQQSDGSYKLRIPDGDVLFTGWRGENGYVRSYFYETTGRILFRWQGPDPGTEKDNYYYVSYDGVHVTLGSVIGGVDTRLTRVSANPTAAFLLEVDFRWQHIDVYYNNAHVISWTLLGLTPLVGFVGVGTVNDPNMEVSNFRFYEYNRAVSNGQLISRLLTYGERWGWNTLADVDASSPQALDVLWGPQSDLDTPAKALRQLLEAGKFEIRYNPDTGYTDISRFERTEADVTLTLQNEILRHEQVNEGKTRPNVVVVDGEVDSWTEFDRADLLRRRRTVNKYLDLPELRTPGEVRQRAEKEVLDARRYNSPGGEAVWRPEMTRMAAAYAYDEAGNRFLVRIEGLSVEFDQGTSPFQHATPDLGNIIYCPPTTPPSTYIARDIFQRTVSSGWDSAEVGGTWQVS